MQFEAFVVALGEPDLRVARGDPVQGPAPRRSQSDAPAADAPFAYLDVDLEFRPGCPRKRNPELAGQARAGRQQSRRPPGRARAVGHAARFSPGRTPHRYSFL